MTRHLLLPALAGLVACAGNPGEGDPCRMATPSTEGWTPYDEGAFTLQLPPTYQRSEVQGIDSQVGRWETPGKEVSYDFGAYSNPLQPDDLNAFPDLVVCQESDAQGSPRIVRYSPAEGGFAVAAHWPNVQERAGRSLSLTVEGAVERAEDQGELIAIIRSVRIGAADAAGRADDSLAGGDAAASSPTSDGGGAAPAAGYRAGGNEPFWTLTFAESTMAFSDVGVGDSVQAPRPEPEPMANGWRFSATADGQPFAVEIENRRCNDSMSGRPFPHSVTVAVLGRDYTGCGGDTASLLIGEEWVVEELEGEGTSGDRRPSLQFSSEGSVTGSGGCNRYRATYEMTGEGLRIGPAAATRMACLDEAANEQETRFFALLEQVVRFDIAEDGSLELLALDRPIIVARRP